MGIIGSDGEQPADVAGAPAAPTRCPSCGNPRRDGLSFCARCGHDFGQAFAPSQTAQPSTEPATARRLERLLIVGIAVAAIVGLVLLVNPPPPTELASRGQSAAPSSRASATSSTTAAPSTGVDLFAGQPYQLDLPAGWIGFDPANPANKAAMDALLSANPALAGPFKVFQSIPNVRGAVQAALGNALVAVATPSGGLSLEALGQSMAAQFRLVPGISTVPAAQRLNLPGGEALTWDLVLILSTANGGTTQVRESVYLFADAETAVLVELVAVGGRGVADEAAIVRTFRFAPGGLVS
jgi:hypothetical protein